jgi:hypothetical protein
MEKGYGGLDYVLGSVYLSISLSLFLLVDVWRCVL